MSKRRIRITVVTDEFLVSKLGTGCNAECRGCGSIVKMLGLEEAMTLAKVGSREIYRRVETGQLHFMETATGHLLICLESLKAWRLIGAGLN